MPLSPRVSNAFITHKLLRKENVSILALPLIIMLAACVIKYVGHCHSGKRFLLYGNIFQE